MRVQTTGNGTNNTGNPAVAIQVFVTGSSVRGDVGVQVIVTDVIILLKSAYVTRIFKGLGIEIFFHKREV